ncbi:MAG TPA: PadR family transcriptional regulator [Acidimicrobiales bacterium]|nr:PadR family transcriptional regulator [Acidimicrobiales bacterium]
MSTAFTLLGLLEGAPSHGYELKRAFDQRFGSDKPLPFGQVYATLGRLQRDGRAVVVGTEAGEGPERKRYAITDQGVTDLERWLAEAEVPEPHLQTVLFSKVVLSLLSGRDAHRFLDTQRAAHLARMRELTELRRTAPLGQALLADYALFHLEADLRWLDLTAARLDDLAREVTR